MIEQLPKNIMQSKQMYLFQFHVKNRSQFANGENEF